MERKFTAGRESAEQRLDLWLSRQMPKVSRKQVKVMLNAGCVEINGRRVVIAGWKLKPGDNVLVKEGKLRKTKDKGQRTKEGKRVEKKRNQWQGQKREFQRLKVYYKDRDIIVVEKPAGILSVATEGNDENGTQLAFVRAYLRRMYQGSVQSFVMPLHRLDAETSGIMVFALSRAGQKLAEQFKAHSIKRLYEAIVLGAVDCENGVVNMPLEKGEFKEGRKVREAAQGEGMKAVTEYRVKERYKDASLLEIFVRTGRTHQIRVHMASQRHPILGDALYGQELKSGHEAVMEEVKKHLGFRRHALHAAILGFNHPVTGKKMIFRSPTPNDMKALIDFFRCSI